MKGAKQSSGKQAVITSLSHLLADTYILYTKTQYFHWNVLSPHFYSYHKMFEKQYQALADAIDLIAERIRALNAPAPGSLAQFLKLATLKEAPHPLEAPAMLRCLLKDHEWMAKQITHLFTIAEAVDDEVTLDMLIARKTEHDQTAWMLRSSLISC
jgi:starvation-inducible DNA-binding protein